MDSVFPFTFIYVNYVRVCAVAHTGQKKASDSLNLELQMGVSYQMWVLEPSLQP